MGGRIRSAHLLHDADQIEALQGAGSGVRPTGTSGAELAAPADRRARGLVLAGVGLILAAAALDGTIVSVALPTIRADLDTGAQGIQWIASIYFLAAAIVLLPAGRLVDLLGARRVVVIGGAVYIVGSLLGATALDSWWIVIGRAIQGAGSGFTAPATLVLVTGVFGDQRRGRALGLVATLVAAASALGPLVGGALTDSVGWRFIFVNHAVMVGVGVLLASAARPVGSRTRAELDLRGTAAWAGAVLAFQLALLQWSNTGTAGGVALLVTSAVCAVLLVRIERRLDEPLFDLGLLRIPAVAAATISKAVVTFAFYGNMYYFTLFLQSDAGYSALATGCILLPASLVGVAVSPFVGRAIDRVGSGPILAIGTAIIASGLFVLAVVNETSSVIFHVVPGLALNGLGYAMVSVSAKSAPLEAVREDLRGRVTSLTSVISKAASGLGVTVATGLFNVYAGPGIDNGIGDYGLTATSSMRSFIEANLGAANLRSTVTSSDAAAAGFSSVSQAVDVVSDSFAFSMSLMLASLGVLVLAGAALVGWLLHRGSRQASER